MTTPTVEHLPVVQVAAALKARLAQGHPWVYRNQVGDVNDLAGGSWVRVRCGGFSAVGLWDTESPIAVRIFARDTVPHAEWVADRVWDAWELRESIRAAATSAYRWLYGEGDGLPGLVVDRYGDYAVVQIYAASLATLLPLIGPALRNCDPELRGVLTGNNAVSDAQPDPDPASVTRLWGELPPPDLVIQEHGLYFHANLFVGQKTGLFLDQRDNRQTVENLSAGRRVLNCFAYTGGFSLYALRGGAAHVTSVDSGHGLAAAATANLALNQLDPARHDFVTADCFALLEEYVRSGRRFDMVILDPPSFARARASVPRALRAYTRLNTLALHCIEPGGLLVSASCTSQVAPEAFREMLALAAARAGRRLQLFHEAGQPSDHPFAASFPEGRYLKFTIGRVGEIL